MCRRWRDIKRRLFESWEEDDVRELQSLEYKMINFINYVDNSLEARREQTEPTPNY